MGNVDGGLVNDGRSRSEAGSGGRDIDSDVVDVDSVLAGRTADGEVDGGINDSGLVTVLGLETGADFTLSDVYSGVLVAVGMSDLKVSFGVNVRFAGKSFLSVPVLVYMFGESASLASHVCDRGRHNPDSGAVGERERSIVVR